MLRVITAAILLRVLISGPTSLTLAAESTEDTDGYFLGIFTGLLYYVIGKI